MKTPNTRRLTTWQIVLITLGAALMLGPLLWDALAGLFKELLNIDLADILSRGGMFAIGLVLLLLVAVYELVKDARDKPKSKYIK